MNPERNIAHKKDRGISYGASVAAIVAAAGKGERLGPKVNKAFAMLGKEPILSYTLKALEASGAVNEVILVVNQEDLAKARLLVGRVKLKKVNKIVAGGKRRIDSVKIGLAGLAEETDYVIVHDGCRPFINNKMISSVLEAAEVFGAAITAVPVKPTIKQIEKGNFVYATLKRDTLVDVQTPQAFKKEILLRAYEKAFAESADATDDAALVERLGIKVKVVDGSYRNIKITTPEDLKYAKLLIPNAAKS